MTLASLANSSAAAPRSAGPALILGGSGTVGSAVVKALCAAGVPSYFSYFSGEDRAQKLQAEHKECCGIKVDLREPSQVRALFQTLDEKGVVPAVLVHCAAVSFPQKISEASDSDFAAVLGVCCQAPFLAAKELAARRPSGGDIVFVGALDRAQSLPLPVHFAGAQGMLSAMTMALSKELGPRGFRVNFVALGPLQKGLSAQLPQAALSDYVSFSALRRLGTADEVARSIVWLACHNTYMTGHVLPVNGGI